MDTWSLYIYSTIGVLFSFLFPVLYKAVRRYFPSEPGGMMMKDRLSSISSSGGENVNTGVLRVLLGTIGPFLSAIWLLARPYLILLLFSLAVSGVIIFLLGKTLGTAQAAFLAGYAWDSTLQKLVGKP